MKRKLTILEPSKVGTQHITLIEGYVRALLGQEHGEVLVLAAQSLFDSLPKDVQQLVGHRAVPVMDPTKGRLALKTLLEFMVAAWAVTSKKRDDLLVITCLLSPALFLLEWYCRIVRRPHVHVVLHAELEALIDPEIRQGISTYGYWCRKWWQMRPANSPIRLVVIDDFIRDALLDLAPCRLGSGDVTTVCMPIVEVPERLSDRQNEAPTVCFLGFRSEFKGFDIFEAAAKRRADFDWVAIGQGYVEKLIDGSKTELSSPQSYPEAIAECDIALFPYKKAYDISLSAALMDAIAANVHVVATGRGCFLSMRETFGPSAVTIYDGDDELHQVLDRYLADPALFAAVGRRAAINASRFGPERIIQQMSELIPTLRPNEAT